MVNNRTSLWMNRSIVGWIVQSIDEWMGPVRTPQRIGCGGNKEIMLCGASKGPCVVAAYNNCCMLERNFSACVVYYVITTAGKASGVRRAFGALKVRMVLYV